MTVLRVFIVSPNDVGDKLDVVAPWLAKMAAWTRGRRTVNDIVANLLRPDTGTNLWITTEPDGKPNGALITRIEVYPRMRMLHVLHCAGEKGHMESVADHVYNALDVFARFNHCAGIEFIGRPGWEKHVKMRGFHTRSVMYQRFFDEANHARVAAPAV